jgi:hypothetical protein
VAKRIMWYALAALLCAVPLGSAYGPLNCSEIYSNCTGVPHPTLQPWMWMSGLGALVGVLGAALIDFVINGRYRLANRTEAKAARRRSEAQGKPSDVSNPDCGPTTSSS